MKIEANQVAGFFNRNALVSDVTEGNVLYYMAFQSEGVTRLVPVHLDPEHDSTIIMAGTIEEVVAG